MSMNRYVGGARAMLGGMIFVGMPLGALSGCSLLISLSDLSGGSRDTDKAAPDSDAGTFGEIVGSEKDASVDVGDDAGSKTDVDARPPLDPASCVDGVANFFDSLTGHCYSRYTAVVSWQDAKSQCESKDGHLVTISSASELAIVWDLAIPADDQVWIGASDLAAEGNWTWVTGEPFVYSNWAEGEPTAPDDEHCAEIYLSDGTWNDSACADSGVFICERE